MNWSCLAHPCAETALKDPELCHVEAVVADVVLGEGRMSGIDLILELRKLDVRAPVVLVTAFADQQRVKAALNNGAAYLLEKPFTTEALRNVLDKVTAVDVDLARLVNRALARARLTKKEEEVARLVLKGSHLGGDRRDDGQQREDHQAAPDPGLREARRGGARRVLPPRVSELKSRSRCRCRSRPRRRSRSRER